MLIINRIKKRIKTSEIIQHKKIEEIEITKEEAKELGNIREINKVKLIVVDKLKSFKDNDNFRCKEDCFAYSEQEGCLALNDLYCSKGKCNFYRNDLEIDKIERDIKKYSMR